MDNRSRITLALLTLLGLTICGLLNLWLFHPPIQVLEISLPEEFFPDDNVVISEEMTIDEFREIVKYVDQEFQTRLYGND